MAAKRKTKSSPKKKKASARKKAPAKRAAAAPRAKKATNAVHPAWKKMLWRSGGSTAVWSAPSGFPLRLPDGTTAAASGRAAFLVLFVANRAALDEAMARLGAFADDTTLWACYPKTRDTDLNRDKLWRAMEPYGMHPVAQIAVDDTWSAMRFKASTT